MRNKQIYGIIIIFAIMINFNLLSYQKFYAYYTKINSGEPFEEYSRTTEHADIKIKLSEPEGELVFWRGTSYLPYWKTESGKWTVDEIIPRNGDGPDKRPDRINLFSRVRIISSDSNQIVVHWRYLPNFDPGNPKGNVDHLNFVNEYFYINSDGSVTRTIKQGTEKWDDWNDPQNKTTQTFQLTNQGISNVQTQGPGSSGTPAAVSANPVLGPVVGSPIIHFKFDEAQGNYATDDISSESFTISGHKSHWRAGVSGTALAFDGYSAGISVPNSEAASLSTFTIDAWVAIGAYPWNWAPILHQSSWQNEGFYLGVNATGNIGLKMQSDSWQDLTTSYQIPLMEWTHIAATYDGSTMKIFVNGNQVESLNVSGSLSLSNSDLIVGKNNHAFEPFDPVRPYCEECHTPLVFSLDALIDEVKLYDQALSAEEIEESFNNYNPGSSILEEPDMDKRELPQGPETGQFDAHYTKLDYYDTWDHLTRFGDHADVVVEFDKVPTKFMFWRGSSYVPQVVNPENQWYNNQFNESWDANGSWGEPMSDKKSNISHVRIIEDTPARKVIHWRYAQVQINGTQQNYDPATGWGDCSDWYYYIYPDGVACKRMVHWSGDDPLNHEWQESIGLMEPGQTPSTISSVNNKTVTFDDLNTTKSYNWSEGLPMELENDWVGRPFNIQVINYNSAYDPFTIADFAGGELYGDIDERTAPYSNMVVYTHWPVGQFPSDGIYAIQPDRTSSNGYTHLKFQGSHDQGHDWAERVMLEGMSNKSISELRSLAKSWLNPADINAISGCEPFGYERAQRAYLVAARDDTVEFSINGSNANPINNPCFIIKNWAPEAKPELFVDGQKMQEQQDFRLGTKRNTFGGLEAVIWLEQESTSELRIKIVGKVQDLESPTPDPLNWDNEPQFLDDDSLALSMAATEAHDPNGVQYFFKCSSDSNHSSGWRQSREYEVTNLIPNTKYIFKVRARDGNYNTTGWSEEVSITTGNAAPPQAYWDFEAGSGEVLFEMDEEFNGTINGAEWTFGHKGQALEFDGDDNVLINNSGNLNSAGNFSWVAWIKTDENGTIMARTGTENKWTEGGKCLYVGHEGNLNFDVGWVGVVGSEEIVNDGEWHQVAVTADVANNNEIIFYIDGNQSGGGNLNVAEYSEEGLPFKIGYCNDDFPEDISKGLIGRIDEVRWYDYIIGPGQLQSMGTDINPGSKNIPTKIKLHDNYPNPFNPATVIKYDLPRQTAVKIEVFNIIGQSVKTLIDKEMTAGFHQVEFDASNLTSGVYIYRIKAGDFIETRKCLLIK